MVVKTHRTPLQAYLSKLDSISRHVMCNKALFTWQTSLMYIAKRDLFIQQKRTARKELRILILTALQSSGTHIYVVINIYVYTYICIYLQIACL